MNALELPSLSPIKIANHAAEAFVQTDGPARRPSHGPHRRGPPVSLNWIPTFAMWPYITKVTVTAIVVVAVAEIAKRSPVWAALLASLPLTSLLAFIWLYLDTGDPERVAVLAQSVFWLVLPSLVLFVVLPLLLRAGWGFWVSLGSSCAATAIAYLAMTWVLGRVGIHV